MVRDFEQFLRDSKPSLPARSVHRAHLRTDLEAALAQKRQRPRRVWLTGSIALIVLLFLVHGDNQLGSGDFSLRNMTSPDDSTMVFSQDYAKTSFSATNTESNPEALREDFEQIWAQMAAGMGTLLQVQGYTVFGSTVFTVTYSYETRGEISTVGKSPTYPVDEYPSWAEEFYQVDTLLYIYDQIDAHQAAYLGTEGRFIDGVPVLFERWAVNLPEFGQVISWTGKPYH
ncbi:MAG: hypothetical protein ABIF77_00160 [bacterium]